jgi:acyl-coenzyme A thioesterase PaaI-like protein
MTSVPDRVMCRLVSRTRPPAGAEVPVRPPGAPTPGMVIPSHYRWCVGCGEDHPTGLHLRIIAGPTMEVHGNFHVSEHHQGAPGLAHGGVLTTALDEVLGSLNWLLGVPAVTARLAVDFLRPVPVTSNLQIHAWITGQVGRKIFTEAQGSLDDSGKAVLAVQATAVFVQVPIEHFLAHGNAADVDRAVADRARGGPQWRPLDGQGIVDVNP